MRSERYKWFTLLRVSDCAVVWRVFVFELYIHRVIKRDDDDDEDAAYHDDRSESKSHSMHSLEAACRPKRRRLNVYLRVVLAR